MNTTDIKYSFIIPHKNTPDLLSICINSIPKNNTTQIIIVDDNSDSKLVDFAKFPGLNDERIEIYFLKNNKGAGYARNFGLRKAKGKWLVFADADDYFFTEILATKMNEYYYSEMDIIYFSVKSYYVNTISESQRYKHINKQISIALKSNNHDPLRYRRFEPWAKFIKRNLIIENNIQFDEVLASNDLMFSVKTGHHAKKISIDKEKIYCLTERQGSLTFLVSKKAYTDRLGVAIRYNNFLYSIKKGKYHLNLFPIWYNLRFFKENEMPILIRKIVKNYRLRYIIWDIIKFFIYIIMIKFKIIKLNKSYTIKE